MEETVTLPDQPLRIVPDSEFATAPMGVPGDFYANMARHISPGILLNMGKELLEELESDRNASEEFHNTYRAAIEATGRHGGVTDPDMPELNNVKHVLLNEARHHAHARLITEMNPQPDPVKFKAVGPADAQTLDIRDRLEEFSNYQLNHIIEGYGDTISRHFQHLALVGNSALKVCWDEQIGAPMVQHIPMDRLILSPDTMELRTSKRYTHQFELTLNEYRQLCKDGFYLHKPEIEMQGGSSHDDDPAKQVDGIEVAGVNDTEQHEASTTLTFYDMYVYRKFDGFHDFMDGGPEVESPYIITVEKESQEIVRVVPNWAPDDPVVRRPIQSIIHFKFNEGVGCYGEGFYHLIGGLDKAATASLRSNLNAASMSLNRPMFVGANVQGGRITPKPGDLIKIKRGDKVKDQFFDLPIMPPDATMLQLLGMMSDDARRIAMITDTQIGEATKGSMPVGTVTALLAQGQVTQTGIHQGVHRKMTELFKAIMRLNWLYQPEAWIFTHTGKSIEMRREDFNPATIDVCPTSDPNVASQTMRMAMAQDAYAMAVNHPDILDVRTAIERVFRAAKVQDWEQLFVQNPPPPYLDPVSENIRAMQGQPIMAFDEQDDPSHIDIHIAFMQDPSLAENAFGMQAQQILYSHVMEHICAYYRKQIMAAIGLPITGEELDPQTEAIITMRVAELVAMAPKVQELRSVRQVTEDPAVETARQMAMLEMEIKQMEAEQDRDIRQQKALDEAMERREKLRAQLQEIQMKAEVKANADNQNTALKIQNLQMSHSETVRLEREQTKQEMQEEHAKHIQEMEQAWEKHKLEMQAELEKLRLEIKKKEEEVKAAKQKAEADKKRSAMDKLLGRNK